MPGDQRVRLRRVLRVDDDLTHLGGALRRAGGQGLLGDPAQRHRRGQPAGRLARALLRIQQLHADEVGERGHADVRQLLRRPGDVQGGADAHAGLVDQLQPLPRPELLGEVVSGHAHAPHPAGPVGQRCQPGQPGVGVALGSGLHVGLHVVRPPGAQHLPQLPFQLAVLRAAPDVGGPQPAQVVGGQSEEPGHRVVHAPQPQFLVEDHRGARRLEDGLPDQRIVGQVVVGGLQRGDREPFAGAVAGGLPVVGEYPHAHRAAVAVAQHQRAAPAVGGQRERSRAVGQQLGGRTPDDLLGPVSQQQARTLAPPRERAVGGDDGPGRHRIVERVVRPHRRHSIAHTHREPVYRQSPSLVRRRAA